MEIRRVPAEDIGEAFELSKQCKLQSDKDAFMRQYGARPELFIAAYDGSRMIGLVHAAEHENHLIVIHGIAVDPDYAGKGVGSQLLREIEAAAREIGGRKLSVGSAAGYVERFYMKNGFEPAYYLALVPELPADYKDKGYEIADEKEERGDHKLYIVSHGYEPGKKDEIRKAFSAREVLYIFDKELISS